LGTKHSTVGNPKFVANVLRKDITTTTVLKLFRNAYYVRDPTNRLAEIAPNGIDKTLQIALNSIDRTLQILQLNVRKMDIVQQSLLNNKSLKDFIALAISKPYL
jgi:hypothetical protein